MNNQYVSVNQGINGKRTWKIKWYQWFWFWVFESWVLTCGMLGCFAQLLMESLASQLAFDSLNRFLALVELWTRRCVNLKLVGWCTSMHLNKHSMLSTRSDVNSMYLSSTEPPAAAEWACLLRPLRGREPEGIWNLLSIVREMFKRRDSNAAPLLEILTEQCLTYEQVHHHMSKTEN